MRQPLSHISLLAALLIAATPGALHACGGSGDEGAADFTGAGQEQAPGTETTESQGQGGQQGRTQTQENPESPTPRTLPEDVQQAAQVIQQEYNVQITGEWTPQGVGELAKALAFYEGKPEYFDRLQRIEMNEVGTLRASRGTGAYFRGSEAGGYIHVYGISQDLPQYQSPSEVVQHELGHYFNISNTFGRDWRRRYQAAVTAGPYVSRYGRPQPIRARNGRPAGRTHNQEWYAEAWSKLLHDPQEPFFNRPTWNRATPETVAIIKERIDASLDPNQGG